MSENITQTEEERALELIVRNQLKIAELEEENKLLKGFFKERKDAYPAGATKEVGKFYIKVSTNRRVDNALALSKLSSLQYKQVSKTVIDPVAAKRYLSPEKYAEIVKTYDNKIEVGLN